MTRTWIYFSLVFFLGFMPAEVLWKKAAPDYSWSFPSDHWARRDFRNEWWYFTGHLRSTGPENRRFAYQLTFFRIGLVPNPLKLDSDWASRSLVMGHAAISDLDNNKHYFSEILHRETPLLGVFPDQPNPIVAWSAGLPGTKDRWTLSWNGEAFDFRMSDDGQEFYFQLSTSPEKPLIFQGPNGYSRKSKSDDNASQYYSFTRLKTQGKIRIEKNSFPVNGISWMDKEFSSGALADNQIGWDWMSLQLEDNSELMLAQLRDEKQEPDFSWANQISRSGEVFSLAESDWNMSPISYWVSRETNARYPVEWKIVLTDRVLKVIAEFEDQENRSSLYPGINYWEGSVRVEDESGNKIGQGFLEMTGYGKSIRLPL